jgi:ribosomal 30S subunit maturation factor RimM
MKPPTDRCLSIPLQTGIVGAKVLSEQGENIGAIKQVLVDKNTGKVTCAVLSWDDFLGTRGKSFVIPFNAFTFDPEANRYSIDITKPFLATLVL